MLSLIKHTTSAAAVTPHPWYALQVKPRREKHVSDVLQCKNYEVFLPLYDSLNQWSDRYKTVQLPLFPGYVFCRLDVNYRLPVLTTPGVLRIVSNGNGPTVVDEKQMLALRMVLAEHLQCEPCSFLQLGQRVRIVSGALAGVEGILMDTRKRQTLVVSIDILHRSVAVEIEQLSVEPVDAPPRYPLVVPTQPLLKPLY